jgi:hypothetical protein
MSGSCSLRTIHLIYSVQPVACIVTLRLRTHDKKRAREVTSPQMQVFIIVMMSYWMLLKDPIGFNEESNRRHKNSFFIAVWYFSHTIIHQGFFYHCRLVRWSCRRLRIILPCTITSQDLRSFESKRGTCWKHSRLLGQKLYCLIGVNWPALHRIDATPDMKKLADRALLDPTMINCLTTDATSNVTTIQLSTTC